MNSVETNATGNKTNGAAPLLTESQMLHSSLLAMAQGHDGSAGATPPALSATPTLSGLVQAIRRRLLLAFGTAFGLTALFVMAVFLLHPPKYNVNARMRIVARQAGPEDVEYSIFKANMEAMVRNPIVLSNALNDRTIDGRDIKDLDIVRSRGMGVTDWLEKQVKTDYLLGPEVLRVMLPADNAEEAAELLNAITRAFLNEYSEVERAKKQARLGELKTKKDGIERELTSLRRELNRLIESLDIKDQQAANVQQGVWLSKLYAAEATKRTLDDAIAKAEGEILTSTARLKTIDKLKTPDEVLYDAFGKDSAIADMQKRVTEIDREIAQHNSKFFEPYLSQVVVPLRAEKNKLRGQIAEREQELKPEIEVRYRKRVNDDLKYRIELAEEQIQTGTPQRDKEQKNITFLLRKVQESGAGNGNEPTQIQAARQNLELARTSLNNTSQRISEVELDPLVSRVIPIQKAAVPLDKDRTQQTKIAGAGGLGVFLLALFGVGFFEFRSRKIAEPDQVATGLGLNVIGTIPALPARTKKGAPKDETAEQKWLARLQESVDSIRTVILHKARADSLHVLMVTSAQSGEGKTTLATQLAASLARAWKRTLMVDADLRHPGAHVLFDVPQEPGLAEILRGEIEPADAVKATPISRLWMIPAGNGDSHAIQALAQDNLRALFEQLKQQYDFIIIDTPPLLPVADGLLIGQHVDGVVYAVLREVSLAPAIYAAQQKLAPLCIHTLGAVVLGAESQFNDKQYGYQMTQPAK